MEQSGRDPTGGGSVEGVEQATEELNDDDPGDTDPREKGPNDMYCSSCGAVIKKNAELCPECGVATGNTGVTGSRSTGTAASGTAAGGSSTGKNTFLVGGAVSGLIAFVLLPIVFGPLSIYCGYRVYRDFDEVQGIAVAAWGGLALVVGMVFGAMMFL
ncbi:zinc-ribbon domain-containing protein [Halobaculum roseum]|uniref:Zinc-ribbon domain-containing protein n=1 Tax=Halobaculum roseum TaxID=2175149 RepID=A0ABD5MGZ3_9EURY|nr:zinc-ribbon domain-containing protein [Halobaculum roseum]QZY02773.1 zinc-ribbon domain-containing protein [Halobaculum roseum]